MRERSSTRGAAAGGPGGSHASERRALVVEPHARARAALGRWLEEEGYAVEAVAHYGEARTVLARLQPHLLVVELRLSAYNGLHLAWHARRSDAAVRVIVTSSVRDPALESNAARLGAVWLPKPLTRRALRDALSLPQPG